MEFEILDSSKRSLFIDKERVDSMTEFTEGRMLITVYNLDLLITKDYRVIHRVSDPDAGNVEKY